MTNEEIHQFNETTREKQLKNTVIIIIAAVLFIGVISFSVFRDRQKATVKNTPINNNPGTVCTIKETYGAFSKAGLDKMIQYSNNKEYTLIQKMIDKHQLIFLKQGLKFILVDGGILTSVIRFKDNEIEMYVVSGSIQPC